MLPRATFGKRHSAAVETPILAPPPVRTKTVQPFLYRGRMTEPGLKGLGVAMLDAMSDDVDEIQLLPDSEGGRLGPALEFYRNMRLSPVKLRTHAAGQVASAATAVFLAGTERTATSGSRFMFHPATVRQDGTHGFIEVLAAKHRRARFQAELFDIYRERTRLPQDLIERFACEEIVLDVQTALKYGVIHDIDDSLTPQTLSGTPQNIL